MPSQAPERPVVLAVCGDAGGAGAVAPVLRALRAGGTVEVKALAYRETARVWAARNIDYTHVPHDIARREIDRLMEPGVALLLTGTSVEPSLEKAFIAVARQRGVPSLAVLDFWSHYVLRFGDADGHLAYVPDRIAVMDDRARSEMVATGFDPSQIVVTGNPALDDVRSWRASSRAAHRQAVRAALGVAPDQLLVVFVSQSVACPDVRDPRFPGFTRDAVLMALMTALDEITQRHGRKIVLVVRPHPAEAADQFECLSNAGRVGTVVSRDGESRDLVLAADLVTGISSMLLMEACYLGCITISLQPGLRLPDTLPANRLLWSRAVYTNDELLPAVEEMLLDSERRLSARAVLSKLSLETCATEKVVELADALITQSTRTAQNRAGCA